MLLFSNVQSAGFMHDLGIGFWSKLRNINNGQQTSYGPYVQYMPRGNFKIKENMSVSLASPGSLSFMPGLIKLISLI